MTTNGTANDERLRRLEDHYKVVNDNTISVTKLTAKVSVLLVIMSFAVIIVSAGTVYTFTGLNTFKDIYADDKLKLYTHMTTLQQTNATNIQSSINSLKHDFDDRFDRFDDRIENLEDVVVKNGHGNK